MLGSILSTLLVPQAPTLTGFESFATSANAQLSISGPVPLLRISIEALSL